MSKNQKIADCCLVPLDTEGEWNGPLLANAAAMSGADCVFASSGAGTPDPAGSALPAASPLDEILDGVQHVIACEAVRDSRNIYDFPAPRGRTAVIVGNEEKGIPRSVLKKADRIVCIPMSGTGMSSINVAVSAAIVLYVFSRDLGRQKRVQSELTQRDVDVLVRAPDDPHELGSLLRSAWAFGWRRVFVDDPHGVWFTRDHQTVIDSRAAARRHKNPLAVLPANQLDTDAYDQVLFCDGRREGTPLSRLRWPPCRRVLVVFNGAEGSCGDVAMRERIFVDHVASGVDPRFRHAGSILLSVLAETLGR